MLQYRSSVRILSAHRPTAQLVSLKPKNPRRSTQNTQNAQSSFGFSEFLFQSSPCPSVCVCVLRVKALVAVACYLKYDFASETWTPFVASTACVTCRSPASEHSM